MTQNSRQNILGISILMLLFLTIMSINGAFLGAERAKIFFNSLPMAIFWIFLSVFLLAAFVIFPSLKRKRFLFLVHFGCILVLFGGIFGSDLCHRILNKSRITSGLMPLRPGQISELVFDKEFTSHKSLPFSVKLVETYVELYNQNDLRMVKDYKSELQIIVNNEVVKEDTIEVNKPLYYGGYHFYQSTWITDEIGPLSGISVESAQGVWLVFSGYAFIFIGLILHFWIYELRKPLRKELAV